MNSRKISNYSTPSTVSSASLFTDRSTFQPKNSLSHKSQPKKLKSLALTVATNDLSS